MKNLAIFCFIFLVIVSCKKSDKQTPADPNAKQYTFVGLTSDVGTMKQGDVTNVKANVTGSVTYKWSCSSGDIFGSGNNVLFGAATCCTGNHTITCTVADTHGNSDSKSIYVIVNPK